MASDKIMKRQFFWGFCNEGFNEGFEVLLINSMCRVTFSEENIFYNTIFLNSIFSHFSCTIWWNFRLHMSQFRSRSNFIFIIFPRCSIINQLESNFSPFISFVRSRTHLIQLTLQYQIKWKRKGEREREKSGSE